MFGRVLNPNTNSKTTPRPKRLQPSQVAHRYCLVNYLIEMGHVPRFINLGDRYASSRLRLHHANAKYHRGKCHLLRNNVINERAMNELENNVRHQVSGQNGKPKNYLRRRKNENSPSCRGPCWVLNSSRLTELMTTTGLRCWELGEVRWTGLYYINPTD